jgi:hypothetical protein
MFPHTKILKNILMKNCLEIYIITCISFLWCWDLNSGPTSCAIPPALFCDGFFQDRFSWTICLGWLATAILLISRIAGVSHWRPTNYIYHKYVYFKNLIMQTQQLFLEIDQQFSKTGTKVTFLICEENIILCGDQTSIRSTFLDIEEDCRSVFY